MSIEKHARRAALGIVREAADTVAQTIEDAAHIAAGGTLADDEDAPEDEATGDATDDEFDDEGEEIDAPAWFYFEGAEALAEAAGAYRAVGDKGDVVALHPAARLAFMGGDEDLEALAEQRGLEIEDFEVYSTPAEIFDLEYDPDTIIGILAADDTDEADASRKNYEDWHWQEASRGAGAVAIPGVTGPLVFLGCMTVSQYLARKDGKTELYEHQHGEATGVLPGLYRLNDNTLIIHGPRLEVRPEGITD